MGQVGRFHLTGFLAWFAWLFVHVLFLVGFRNRVAVVLQWAWHYATFGRGARLIVDTAEQWQLAHDLAREGREAAPGGRTSPIPGIAGRRPAETISAVFAQDDAASTTRH